jgi:hypothetical protein
MNRQKPYDDEQIIPAGVFRTPLYQFNYTPRPGGGNLVDALCGFCFTEQRCNIWSLCGSGKRCDNCFALLGPLGTIKDARADMLKARADRRNS